jgi:hypothetical protein
VIPDPDRDSVNLDPNTRDNFLILNGKQKYVLYICWFLLFCGDAHTVFMYNIFIIYVPIHVALYMYSMSPIQYII